MLDLNALHMFKWYLGCEYLDAVLQPKLYLGYQDLDMTLYPKLLPVLRLPGSWQDTVVA